MTSVVKVSQVVTVTVDESKFTPEFLSEFRKYFYPFETVQDHINHIAQSYARGIVSHRNDFLEGYGKLAEFGVDFDCDLSDSEVEAQ